MLLSASIVNALLAFDAEGLAFFFSPVATLAEPQISSTTITTASICLRA